MHIDCIAAASKAAGRTLSPGEIAKIEADIIEHMKSLSRAKPQEYAAMSHSERVMAAAQLAQDTALATAALKKQRAMQQVITAASLTDRFKEARATGLNGARAVNVLLEQADIYMKGVPREYFANLMPVIKSVEPRFFGLMEDVAQVRIFVHEVLNNANGSSNNPKMQKAARAWLDTIESMRVRFNRAGGDIGKLAYGYLPQMHDASRVREVTADAWANQTMPLLDRSRYVDLNGRQLGDAGVLNMLRQAHATISTEGTNTLTPGQFQGTGARANRGSDHRVIHFKDADSYITYLGEYGSGSVFTSMQGHVTGMGRDIGLVEQFGPNPELAFKTVNDMAIKVDGGVKRFGQWLVTNEQQWAVLSGKSGQVQHQRLANIAQGARNIQVFGKLGSALLSSITDIPSFFVTTRFNRLPVIDSALNLVRSLGSDTREFANRAGIVSDSLIADMNRWSESNLKDGWTSKLANATMKVSLLQGWTDAIRRAFSVSMMGGLGKISRTDWNALHVDDRGRMAAKGVTADDWKLWQMATPERWRNSDMLTPESIRAVTDAQLQQAGLIAQVGDPKRAAQLRDQSVARLLGVITDEAEYASVAPDLHTRTLTTFGGQERGTFAGELGRSVMLFKGFPIAMMSRHWGRVLNADMTLASRTEYVASLAVGLTVFGAMAIQLKDLRDGKDPRDMTSPKFWGAAFMQGGGTGFVGDLIYQASGGGQSQSGVSTAANVASAVAGPVAGMGLELADLTFGNIGQAMKGKDTHAGAEALRFVRSNSPFVNLWYAKTAIDHAGYNQLQELLSPGYSSRVAQRIRKDWGQYMWWPRDSIVPDRAPNFGNAVGN
jgi:hypothetical protein